MVRDPGQFLEALLFFSTHHVLELLYGYYQSGAT